MELRPSHPPYVRYPQGPAITVLQGHARFLMGSLPACHSILLQLLRCRPNALVCYGYGEPDWLDLHGLRFRDGALESIGVYTE